MRELDARIIATNVTERLLRLRGPQQPFQLRVEPNGSGVTIRAGFMSGLVVQSIVPPGYFDYDRIADDLSGQIDHAVIDSDS